METSDQKKGTGARARRDQSFDKALIPPGQRPSRRIDSSFFPMISMQ